MEETKEVVQKTRQMSDTKKQENLEEELIEKREAKDNLEKKGEEKVVKIEKKTSPKTKMNKRFTWGDWGLQDKAPGSKSSPNLKVNLKKHKKDKKNMKQLKVKEMIGKIEEQAEKEEAERKKEEVKKKREEENPGSAVAPSSTSSKRRLGSRTEIKKHCEDKNLELGKTKIKDGRKLDLRTSLIEIATPVKNTNMKNKSGENGDRKGQIKDLIEKFNKGGDGKVPLARPENKK